MRKDNLNLCNVCAPLAESILKDYRKPAKETANLPLDKLQELLSDKPCQIYMICLPSYRVKRGK